MSRIFLFLAKRPTGFKRLFMTHPPLEERIAALQSGTWGGKLTRFGCYRKS